VKSVLTQNEQIVINQVLGFDKYELCVDKIFSRKGN